MEFVVELRNRRPSAFFEAGERAVYFENSIVSKKLYIKLMRVQLAIFAGHLLALFNAYLIFDSSNVLEWSSPLTNQFLGSLSLLDALLLLQSLFSLFLLVANFFHERLSWDYRLKRGMAVGSFVGTLLAHWKEVLAYTLLEIFHPNYLLAHYALWNPGNTFSFESGPNGQPIEYSLNDILCSLGVFRGVAVFVLLIHRLDYNSDTSFRVWLSHQPHLLLRQQQNVRTQVSAEAAAAGTGPLRPLHSAEHLQSPHPRVRVPPPPVALPDSAAPTTTTASSTVSGTPPRPWANWDSAT